MTKRPITPIIKKQIINKKTNENLRTRNHIEYRPTNKVQNNSMVYAIIISIIAGIVLSIVNTLGWFTGILSCCLTPFFIIVTSFIVSRVVVAHNISTNLVIYGALSGALVLITDALARFFFVITIIDSVYATSDLANILMPDGEYIDLIHKLQSGVDIILLISLLVWLIYVLVIGCGIGSVTVVISSQFVKTSSRRQTR